jgi:hypothetical protein
MSFERIDSGLIEVLFWHFPEWTEENHGKFYNRKCSGGDSNRTHTKYESRGLLLCDPAL